MGNTTDRQLDTRLNAYAATVSTLKRSAEKWPVYAAVTGAAMAMASSASASVIYSGPVGLTASLATARHFGAGTTAGVATSKYASIAHATGQRIVLQVSHQLYQGASYGRVGVGGFSTGLRFITSGNFVKRFSSGVKISSGAGSFKSSLNPLARTYNGQRVPGGWSQTQGFAGFEFRTINGKWDYGWARLQFTLGDHITLTDYAFDNSGQAILTGEGAPATTPEPSSFALATPALMLLAAGAAGVEALRKRRAKELSAISS